MRDVTHCNILHHTTGLGLTNAHSKMMFIFSAEFLWIKRLCVSPDLQIKEHTLDSNHNSVISEAAPALRSAQVNGLVNLSWDDSFDEQRESPKAARAPGASLLRAPTFFSRLFQNFKKALLLVPDNAESSACLYHSERHALEVKNILTFRKGVLQTGFQ